MTIITEVHVHCSECGWSPKRKYHLMISTSSFCNDGTDPRIGKRYCIPETCSKCGSADIAITPTEYPKQNDPPPCVSQMDIEERDIPVFLRRYREN